MTSRLAFTQYREKERTKHVHRLHPYKGKFIPQLVEYFLDDSIDELKTESWFKPGDIVLDPFCGSGTTLVQAAELGIHAVGVDISEFNTLISNTKISNPDLNKLHGTARNLIKRLRSFNADSTHLDFDIAVTEALSEYNKMADMRYGKPQNPEFAAACLEEFLQIWQSYICRYGVQLRQENSNSFLECWYAAPVRKEIEFLHSQIKIVADAEVRNVLLLALTRTLRSCRATTHADLATLKEPVFEPYYCRKHSKICKPILTATKWWERYALDSVSRIAEFRRLRASTHQVCVTADSRAVELEAAVGRVNTQLGESLSKQGVRGIFTSPPYVGLIDYHEQHAYAYELLGLPRRDSSEIGPMSDGQGRQAREQYVEAISNVLLNCRRFFCDDYDVFVVANDKWNLYPLIANLSGMRIVKRYERPVLYRTEKNRNSPYNETIFHLRDVS